MSLSNFLRFREIYKHPVGHYIQWTLFLLLAFLASLYLAWQLLVKMDFLYPLWYEVIGIDKTIAEYGPQNRYRDHFQETTKTERIALFAALVKAIHQRGQDLETLVYHDTAGTPIRFLRPPEIVHLRDVARLVEQLMRIGIGSLMGWLVMISLLRWQGIHIPPVRVLLTIAAGLILTSTVAVWLIGPVEMFYGLHTWVFPEDHPWFFYYQDSLMTTLMKAPVIFGYIALVLVLLSLVILSSLLFFSRRLYRFF